MKPAIYSFKNCNIRTDHVGTGHDLSCFYSEVSVREDMNRGENEAFFPSLREPIRQCHCEKPSYFFCLDQCSWRQPVPFFSGRQSHHYVVDENNQVAIC